MADIRELANLIEQNTETDGVYATAIPRVRLSRVAPVRAATRGLRAGGVRDGAGPQAGDRRRRRPRLRDRQISCDVGRHPRRRPSAGSERGQTTARHDARPRSRRHWRADARERRGARRLRTTGIGPSGQRHEPRVRATSRLLRLSPKRKSSIACCTAIRPHASAKSRMPKAGCRMSTARSTGSSGISARRSASKPWRRRRA